MSTLCELGLQQDYPIFFSNYFRKDVRIANPIGFLNAYITQSQNASAKLALTVDQFYTNYVNSKFIKKNHDWNKIDKVFLTSHDVFHFYGSSYYTRMLIKIIDDLIPTGVMDYLIEKYYTKKWKFGKIGKEPNILSLESLAFGFNIWISSCLICVLVFVAELVVKFITKSKKPKKIKYAKVNPIDDGDDQIIETILTADMVKRFRNKTCEIRDHLDSIFGEEISLSESDTECHLT